MNMNENGSYIFEQICTTFTRLNTPRLPAYTSLSNSSRTRLLFLLFPFVQSSCDAPLPGILRVFASVTRMVGRSLGGGGGRWAGGLESGVYR